MTFWKRDLDKACKDKSSRQFESNFRVTVSFREYSKDDEGKRCFACGKVVSPQGPTVHCGNRIWHWACARCSKCQREIGSKYMFSSTNEPLCIKCAQTAPEGNAFLRFCAACSGVLDTDDIVDALERTWHRTCFCCSACACLLSTDAFSHIGTRLFCSDCTPQKGSAPPSPSIQRPQNTWNKASPTVTRGVCPPLLHAVRIQQKQQQQQQQQQQQRPADSTAAPSTVVEEHTQMCNTCGKPIAVGQEFVRIEGKFLHALCFVCNRCGVQLAGTKYFDGPNGAPLCAACNKDVVRLTLPMCAACATPIEDNSVIIAGEQRYHHRCFVCASCSREVMAQYVPWGGKLYCPDCHARLFMKRCVVCTQVITGKFIEVEGKAFHVTCLRCDVCHTELHGARFFRDPASGKWHCEACHNFARSPQL